MYGSGARIPLRFDPALKFRGGPQGAGGLGLFPGAMAAFKGKNGGGGWFLVAEILAVYMNSILGIFGALISCSLDSTSQTFSVKSWTSENISRIR
jgi:hypothetical protein